MPVNEKKSIPDELLPEFCRRIGAFGVNDRLGIINGFIRDYPVAGKKQTIKKFEEVATKGPPPCVPLDKKDSKRMYYYLRPMYYHLLPESERPNDWEKYAREDIKMYDGTSESRKYTFRHPLIQYKNLRRSKQKKHCPWSATFIYDTRRHLGTFQTREDADLALEIAHKRFNETNPTTNEVITSIIEGIREAVRTGKAGNPKPPKKESTDDELTETDDELKPSVDTPTPKNAKKRKSKAPLARKVPRHTLFESKNGVKTETLSETETALVGDFESNDMNLEAFKALREDVVDHLENVEAENSSRNLRTIVHHRRSKRKACELLRRSSVS